MSRAVIYARYSSASQSADTIEVQTASCTSHCERQGYAVIYTYIDEAKSGTTEHGRDAYLRMLEDGRSGMFDAVVAYKFDRLGRSFFESIRAIFELETSEIVVESATENNDRLTRNILLSVADNFSQQLSERVKDSLVRHAHEGKHITGVAPLGYKKTEGRLEIDESSAHVVREIFELRSQGYGYRSIGLEMTSRGYRGKRGHLFSPQMIRYIVRNPHYMGDTVWARKKKTRGATGGKYYKVQDTNQWIVSKNTHEPLIDTGTWEKAQKPARDVAGRPIGPNGQYLLTGMMTCAECGKTYQRKKYVKGLPRYRCLTRMTLGVEACSNAHTIPEETVHEWILECIEDLTSEDTSRIQIAEAKKSQTSRRSTHPERELQRQIQKVEVQIQNIVSAVQEGKPMRSLLESLESLERRRDDLERRILDIETPIPIPTLKELKRRAAEVREAIREGDMQVQRNAVAAVFSSIVVHPGHIVASARALDPDAPTWDYTMTTSV